jgi:acyl-CoA thioesterase YciA
MATPHLEETLTHHLVLPRDANHHGKLYAGVLVSLALEAAYATAFRGVGLSANLVLKRVLDIRCYKPVAIGRVIEIRGCEVLRARAHVVVALWGTPLSERGGPWMDALMQFVQVDEAGRPKPFETEPGDEPVALAEPWQALRKRGLRLLGIRS